MQSRQSLERSKSIPRLNSIVRAVLSPRKSMATATDPVPPTLDIDQAQQLVEFFANPPPPSPLSVSSRKSSSLSSRSQSIEFQVLPVAPASFERRRPSSNDLNAAAAATAADRSAGMNRRSASSFAALQPKSEEDVGGTYGWDEQQSAAYNREYVEFMKSKGIRVSLRTESGTGGDTTHEN
ncbi:UNVERIFIED_CONTAM: hypothetical protein HDU68_007105 [Siphonaria sp. JEL0065]|nr:hypothetical protein HDU68_007105 [Siphonaria sp. JEL0065]